MTATRRHMFETGGAPRLEARLTTGRLRLAPGAPGRVEVEVSGSDAAVEGFGVEQHGDTITLRPEGGMLARRANVDLLVRVGEEAHLDARLAAADLAADAPLAVLRVTAASGDVSAERVTRETALKTASGDVALGAVGGRVDVTTASGDLRVASLAADGAMTTASGDLVIERLRGSVSLRTLSGDLDVRRFETGDLRCQTVSGDAAVGLPPGRTLDVDLQTMSGKVRNDLAVDPATASSGSGRLSVRTMSGDILLRSVAPAEG